MKAKKSKIGVFLPGMAILSLLVYLSCKGNGVGLTENGDLAGASGFTAEIQPIFDTNCVRCHAPGGLGFTQTGGSQNNGLNLTRGNSYRSLVNQLTHQFPESDPKWRVVPGDPAGSYIIEKILSGSPKFGKRMPFDGPPFLSQSEIQLIRSWIEQGAPND